MGFWFDGDTPSGTVGAEDPPTEYGKSAAAEDLAESVAIFFINGPALKAKCPERAKFLRAMVARWEPKKKTRIKADMAKKKGKKD